MLDLSDLFAPSRLRRIHGQEEGTAPPTQKTLWPHDDIATAAGWQRLPDPAGGAALRCHMQRASVLLQACEAPLRTCMQEMQTSRSAIQECRSTLTDHCVKTDAVRALLAGDSLTTPSTVSSLGSLQLAPIPHACVGCSRCFFCRERLALEADGMERQPVTGISPASDAAGDASSMCASSASTLASSSEHDAWLKLVKVFPKQGSALPARERVRRKTPRQRGHFVCKSKAPPVPAQREPSTWYATHTEEPLPRSTVAPSSVASRRSSAAAMSDAQLGNKASTGWPAGGAWAQDWEPVTAGKETKPIASTDPFNGSWNFGFDVPAPAATTTKKKKAKRRSTVDGSAEGPFPMITSKGALGVFESAAARLKEDFNFASDGPFAVSPMSPARPFTGSPCVFRDSNCDMSKIITGPPSHFRGASGSAPSATTLQLFQVAACLNGAKEKAKAPPGRDASDDAPPVPSRRRSGSKTAQRRKSSQPLNGDGAENAIASARVSGSRPTLMHTSSLPLPAKPETCGSSSCSSRSSRRSSMLAHAAYAARDCIPSSIVEQRRQAIEQRPSGKDFAVGDCVGTVLEAEKQRKPPRSRASSK